MTVINTNTAATLTANALTKNERAMSQAMERLSTGVRINSAADDAAGLAISSRMTSQVNGLNMAVRNANDAISMVQTADGALVEVTNMLQRMRELAVQSASGTMAATDRTALDVEFEALDAEILRISQNTEFNGTKILDGSLGAVAFQVGANASQTISITFGDLSTEGVSSTSDQTVDSEIGTGLLVGLTSSTIGAGTVTTDLAGLDIGSGATAAITALDFALDKVNSHRATIGATVNRLEYAADNLANVSQNTSASRSRILDADYASETTELARTQIIQQAGTAMLSQANQAAQSVLSLLR
tara:strand:+ start:1437 stop:2342 length:906 start_codon:yes stop_codon:yes gene_type:complete